MARKHNILQCFVTVLIKTNKTSSPKNLNKIKQNWKVGALTPQNDGFTAAKPWAMKNTHFSDNKKSHTFDHFWGGAYGPETLYFTRFFNDLSFLKKSRFWIIAGSILVPVGQKQCILQGFWTILEVPISNPKMPNTGSSCVQDGSSMPLLGSR